MRINDRLREWNGEAEKLSLKFLKYLRPKGLGDTPLRVSISQSIYWACLNGISSMKVTDGVLMSCPEVPPVNTNLVPNDPKYPVIFFINTMLRPVYSVEALSLYRNMTHIKHQMSDILSKHGDVVRYITNVSQQRMKSYDMNSGDEEFLVFSRDALDESASLGQLTQATLEPQEIGISILSRLLRMETGLPINEVLAPADISILDAESSFTSKLNEMRENLAIGVNQAVAWSMENTGETYEWEGEWEAPENEISGDQLLKASLAQEKIIGMQKVSGVRENQEKTTEKEVSEDEKEDKKQEETDANNK